MRLIDTFYKLCSFFSIFFTLSIHLTVEHAKNGGLKNRLESNNEIQSLRKQQKQHYHYNEQSTTRCPEAAITSMSDSKQDKKCELNRAALCQKIKSTGEPIKLR